MSLFANRIKRRTAERRWVTLHPGDKEHGPFQLEVCLPTQAIKDDIQAAMVVSFELKKKAKGGGDDDTQRMIIESNVGVREVYAKEVVTGMRGCTMALVTDYLRVPIDPEDVELINAQIVANADVTKGCVPYDKENMLAIYCAAQVDRCHDKVVEFVNAWQEEAAAKEVSLGKVSGTSSNT